METQLKQMADFLATEERRAGIYLTETQDDGDDGTPAVTEQQVWGKVQDTLKVPKTLTVYWLHLIYQYSCYKVETEKYIF